MSRNSDDEFPRFPRARAYSHDVIRTSARINEQTSSTSANSGMTSNIVRWTYTPQSFRSGSENRQPVRRANTWG